ncbi:MAG TPA: hypothetical protein VHY20_10815 [Pirellulales bacterium]|nr:hypothetical protein [Pirellulales bacterium]
MLLSGCVYFPELSRQPVVHNPFPQLSKIAVAPFFNHSTEPTVDGRQFALAYFNELQRVPGFEVVPVGVVEQRMQAFGITLASPDDARRLAQLLEVDAVVVGAVTDYTPYYPPRCAMQVEWYTANPNFHPVPPGYGLPWGTPDEEQIPPSLVFQARMALAREQMKTQEPAYRPLPVLQPLPAERGPEGAAPAPQPGALPPAEAETRAKTAKREGVQQASAQADVTDDNPTPPPAQPPAGLPLDWPDPQGFTPLPPLSARPAGVPTAEPVLRHARTYNGNDADVTEALSTYVYFRDDARFGGWQSYLQRSDDFIRFCCYLHITEMLTARGGAGETRAVWRWPTNR